MVRNCDSHGKYYAPCISPYWVLFSYVIVIWFDFHVSQLLPSKLHNETCIALENTTPIFCITNKNFCSYTPIFCHGYEKRVFVDSLTKYIGLPICGHY